MWNSSPTLGMVLATAALAGCGASEPGIDHWAPAPPGASWEVAQRNTGSFGSDSRRFTVTREEGRWKGAPAVALRSSLGSTTMAEPVGGRQIAVLDADGRPVVSYDPPVGWVYPLKIGSSWSQRQRVTVHATNRTIQFESTCRVEDFENVTVRAGSFNAFRIHCTGTDGSDETYWSSPRMGTFVKVQLRRAPTSPFGPGTHDAELVSRPAMPAAPPA